MVAKALRLHHVAYLVESIEAAVPQWTAVGAGPFFRNEHVPFDGIEMPGIENPYLDHSSAFGHWDPIRVELVEIHGVSDSAFARSVAGAPGISHRAYVCKDPKVESERLARSGCPFLLRARIDAAEVEVTFHDSPQLGHALELHCDTPALRAVFANLESCAREWDGRSQPLRTWPP